MVLKVIFNFAPDSADTFEKLKPKQTSAKKQMQSDYSLSISKITVTHAAYEEVREGDMHGVQTSNSPTPPMH